MPKDLLRLSREQPATAIVIVIVMVTLFITAFTLTPWYGPAEVTTFTMPTGTGAVKTIGIVNMAIILGTSVWFLWAAKQHRLAHMSRSTFVLFLVWFLSAMNRIVLIVSPGQLLWVPFLLVALILGVCYVYFNALRRDSDVE